MNHDFSIQPDGDEANRFITWLQDETVASLKSSYGNLESLKSSLFVYANRAYESKMEETRIYNLLAISVVRAGYAEEEEAPVFDIFESFAQIARGVTGYI